MQTPELKDGKIMALWWKQPFASAMLLGKIETRVWKTNVRGKVLICSSKYPYGPMDLDLISEGLQFEIFKQARRIWQVNDSLDYNGYAIAIGDLVDCRPMHPNDEEKCFVRYREGLWCHVYENVVPIKPFEIKGCHGWRILTDEQKKLIEYT